MGAVSNGVKHAGDAMSHAGQAIENGKTGASIISSGTQTSAEMNLLGEQQMQIMLENARLSFMVNCAQCIKDLANHQL